MKEKGVMAWQSRSRRGWLICKCGGQTCPIIDTMHDFIKYEY